MVLHFLIQGRVQGVGFRWFVHREASELDLRGWVRNTEDGDVEVVAAGEAADLDELRASLTAARAAAVSTASSNTSQRQRSQEPRLVPDRRRVVKGQESGNKDSVRAGRR